MAKAIFETRDKQLILAAVDLLQSKDDIESYDYRVGYPNKLEF